MRVVTTKIGDHEEGLDNIDYWPTKSAASVLATIPPLVLVLIFQKYLVSGILAGATKG